MKKVCDEIMSQFPHFSHPLLIPTVLIELTAADLMSELYHIHRLLAKAEDKTRFGDWELSDATADFPDAAEQEQKGEDDDEKKDGVANDNHDDDSLGNGGLRGEVGEAKLKRESAYWAAMERAMRDCTGNHELARLLGSLNCRFAFMNVAVRCSISMAEFTLREMEHMKKACADTPARFGRLAEVTHGESLRHRVELLLSNLRHMDMFAAIDQRMQAQQNIVSRGLLHGVGSRRWLTSKLRCQLFNLITQDDSNLNMGIAKDSKELAEASKRDSTAMKIIALLTTIFLPGTFLAVPKQPPCPRCSRPFADRSQTFFAMPLFNWSASTMSDVGTSHLWLYWAVAIPATVVLIVAVGAFAFIQDRKNKEATRKARDNVGGGKV